MIRSSLRYLLLTVIYLVTWLAGVTTGITLLTPASAPASGSESAFDPMLLVVAALHTLVLVIYLRHTDLRGWRMVLRLAAISFGLTFLITQVESLWFINPLNMEKGMVYGLMAGGLASSLIFAWAAVRIIPARKEVRMLQPAGIAANRKSILLLLFLIVIAWPALYFLAGYYIAWQSPELREYYSSTVEMKSFLEMMEINILEGLYTFQVLRSLIWLALAYIILRPLDPATVVTKMILTGSLFAVLGSSQLLLENPIMPDTIRIVHLIETAVSTFIWGAILGYSYDKVVTHNVTSLSAEGSQLPNSY